MRYLTSPLRTALSSSRKARLSRALFKGISKVSVLGLSSFIHARSKIFGHTDTNHACPAPEHECGMVRLICSCSHPILTCANSPANSSTSVSTMEVHSAVRKFVADQGMDGTLSKYDIHEAGAIYDSESPHDDHTCNQQSCPLQCQLCRRLCSDGDHLHALRPGLAVHLCG